jgi:benzoyl-CoA reductase/2-hydroxyglutaryl-CoA dehydratase subunit BcrC/BadD/HgdB
MPEEKKSKIKKIKAAGQMKKIMAEHFYELDEAAKSSDKKVAWCTSVGPAELLLSFGFRVYYPENHGAMLGATRMAMDLIPSANAIGYSPDICSYLTSDVGSYLQKKTPIASYPGITSIPKPDVVVYNNNQCRDVQDWLYFYHREFGVPILGIETYRGVGEVEEHHVKSIATQMENMIEPLEKISGRKFDEGELKRVLGLSKQTSDLWKKVLRTAAHIPSPFTFFDGTIHMGPAVVMRGDPRSVEYYKLLLEELEENTRKNEAAVEGEKNRLYWDGMPIWGKLRELSELFIDLKTCVVASTYCNSWIFRSFNPEDPINSMARAYTEIFIVRSEAFKQKYIEDMVREYKINGILFHDSKTCPSNSNDRYGMPERLQKKLSVPTLTIHADLNDLRCYSEEQTKTSIETFAEQLK